MVGFVLGFILGAAVTLGGMGVVAVSIDCAHRMGDDR